MHGKLRQVERSLLDSAVGDSLATLPDGEAEPSPTSDDLKVAWMLWPSPIQYVYHCFSVILEYHYHCTFGPLVEHVANVKTTVMKLRYDFNHVHNSLCLRLASLAIASTSRLSGAINRLNQALNQKIAQNGAAALCGAFPRPLCLSPPANGHCKQIAHNILWYSRSLLIGKRRQHHYEASLMQEAQYSSTHGSCCHRWIC